MFAHMVFAVLAVVPSYPSGPLQGRDLDVLFEIYVGVRGRIPATVNVNYCDQLEGIWKRKDRRANAVSDKTGDRLVGEYCSVYRKGRAEQFTLQRYVEHVDGVVTNTRTNIDWMKIRSMYGLQSAELAVVRAIADQLDGQYMLAYALTELMPSMRGADNVVVTDYLLSSAGRPYFESLPALYDKYTSFGPYQFTAFAWYETKREARGGSKANRALPEGIRVPHGSVTKLRGDQHHQAAFLFALHNLASTIGRLNASQLTMLHRVARSKMSEIVQFIATAHHMPGRADDSLERWLDNRCQRPYAVSCNRRLARYARKTASNIAALAR